jgi:signal transduction histidine kinase
MQPIIDTLGVSSGTTMPIRFGGVVRGFEMLGLVAERPDVATDVEFGRSLADCVGMALDRDRLLRETRRAVATRERALSIVSHDLRNPLSAIHICATALLDPIPAPEAGVRHMAELILRSAEWMQHIVQDLLDRASLDAGRITLRRRQVQPSELLAHIAKLFEPIAEDHSIELVVSSDPALQMHADPDRVLQALANLLGNAMKFTPAGGRIEVSAGPGESASEVPGRPAVRLSVRDTGAGIAPEDIAHVFDWFWRTSDGDAPGAGLGLAIAKGLVEAHQSHLHVESVLGRGTTFWFTLPGDPMMSSAQPKLEMLLS